MNCLIYIIVRGWVSSCVSTVKLLHMKQFVVLFLDRCPNVTPTDPCICMFAPGAPPQCHDLGTNYECANNALCCPDGCNKGMCYY